MSAPFGKPRAPRPSAIAPDEIRITSRPWRLESSHVAGDGLKPCLFQRAAGAIGEQRRADLDCDAPRQPDYTGPEWRGDAVGPGRYAVFEAGDKRPYCPGDIRQRRRSQADSQTSQGSCRAAIHPELTQLGQPDTTDMIADELFDDAVRIVLDSKRGSVSLLQRRLGVGYARASRMIEQMAALGILGEYKGSQAREVMMGVEDWEQLRGQMEQQNGLGHPSRETENGGEQGTEDSSYVNEGQQGYAAVDKEED